MCSVVEDESATASLYKIPVDDSKWVIPNNLFLNNVPHSKFARQFFYNKVLLFFVENGALYEGERGEISLIEKKIKVHLVQRLIHIVIATHNRLSVRWMPLSSTLLSRIG